MKNIFPILDVTPFSYLDYPDHLSCILWFGGCNFRCPYCYNAELVEATYSSKWDLNEIYQFLLKRKGKLDGIVLSGGECTLHPKLLKEVGAFAKFLGYDVKMDTNGYKPEIVTELVNSGLVDYVALDLKSDRAHSKERCGKARAYDRVIQSLQYLLTSKIPFEIRTTYHSALMSFGELLNMGRTLIEISYSSPWFIQDFKSDVSTLTQLPPSNKMSALINEVRAQLPELSIIIR